MHVVTILSLITCVLANFEDDIFAGTDPKDNYFRYVRTYAQSDYPSKDESSLSSSSEAGDVPKPFGFRIYYPASSKRSLRTRREEATATIGTTTGTLLTSPISSDDPPLVDEDLTAFDDDLKPLELDILELDNSTDVGVDDTQDNDLVINDFIRFKRDLTTPNANDNKKQETILEETADSIRPKREHERRESKMLLSPGETLPDGINREPRGAVKEQWLKQPYQIQAESSNRNYDENPLNGEPPNAPRVHFVTQRRSESVPPLVYHSYDREREGRSRDLTRQRDIDLDRDIEPAYYPRPARHYNSQVGDGYPRRDRDFYPRDRDNDPIADRNRGRYYNNQDRFYEEDRPIPSFAKQKRIIYYATLPEISRQPGLDRERDRDRDQRNFRRYRPDDHYPERDRDLDRERDRGHDRERERDNRLPSEDRYAAQPINYRFRNESPYEARDKTRYDEATATKSAAAPYPGKVSSMDVNVRALKKNSERRIYTEVERRYPYKASSGYHHDDGPAAYDGNHR